MAHKSIRTIREEHSSLGAMLRSMTLMVQRGTGDNPEKFFDVLRAMLFYMDEFPQRLHHTKETELLFPSVAARSAATREVIAQLEHEHAVGVHDRVLFFSCFCLFVCWCCCVSEERG